MQKQKVNSKKAFTLSVCLHIIVLLFFIASLEFSSPMLVVSNDDPMIVEAVALQDSPLIAPPEKLAETQPLPHTSSIEPPPLPPPLEAASKPVEAPKPAPAEEIAKASQEQEKTAIAIDHKKPREKKVKIVKKDLTKQLLADLENEIAKQAKTKKKILKNKFSKELKAQSEKALQELMKEPQKTAGARSQHNRGLVDKYKALILQAISQQWVVPSHVDKHLTCELLIKLAPGGVVVDVSITKSSGNALLDHSAKTAVFRASPLPVPDDIYSFESFREFVLKVKPENILESTNGDQGFWIE